MDYQLVALERRYTIRMDAFFTFAAGQFSIELFLVLGAWIFFAVWGYMFGVSKLNAIALTIIITAFFMQHIHNTWLVGSFIGDTAAVWIETFFITGAITISLYLIFMRLCNSGFSDGGDILSTAISALAVLSIFLATWSSTFTILWPFPELLVPIFAPIYFLWWLMGSLVILMIMHQKRIWK